LDLTGCEKKGDDAAKPSKDDVVAPDQSEAPTMVLDAVAMTLSSNHGQLSSPTRKNRSEIVWLVEGINAGVK
jgi:hypothetical protein